MKHMSHVETGTVEDRASTRTDTSTNGEHTSGGQTSPSTTASGRHLTERLTSYSRADLVFDVVDSGPLDGPIVVLLHGFPQRAGSWDAVRARLNDEGLRTLAPDQRGYSPGARPPRRRDYVTGQLVADVLALIDAVGAEQVHLVGHDWGANVAWSLAAVRPDRLSSLTALSVPHPAALVRAMRTFDQARRSWYIGGFQLPWLPERVLSSRAADRIWRDSGMTDAMVDRYRREIVEDGALHTALHWYRALPLFRGRHLGGRTRVPTTLLWSDGDVALGWTGAQLTHEHVTGEFVLDVVAGASHWLPEERPDRVAKAVLHRVSRT